MNILIVNDDGITSKGLEMLSLGLSSMAHIYVAAPKEEQSAKSHSITIANRIKMQDNVYVKGATGAIAIEGSPADCVRIGLQYFNVDFDLVIAGINDGCNLATDIVYSGTVAAAKEALILSVPSIAISAHNVGDDFVYDEAIKVIDEIITNKLYSKNAILNINIPKIKPKGVKLAIQGQRLQHSEYIVSERRGVFHIQHSTINYAEKENADILLNNEGFITVTPLKIDQTDLDTYKELNKYYK